MPLFFTSSDVVGNPLFVARSKLQARIVMLRQNTKMRWAHFFNTTSLLVRHPLVAFFTTPVLLECRATVPWLTFSSSTMPLCMVLGWRLLLPPSRRRQPPKAVSVLTGLLDFSSSKFLELVRSDVVSSLHALVTFRVDYAALWPSLNSLCKTKQTSCFECLRKRFEVTEEIVIGKQL